MDAASMKSRIGLSRVHRKRPGSRTRIVWKGQDINVNHDNHQAVDEKEPRPGRYIHYKGNAYEVLGIARHSETMEELVVYRALYGEHGLWVRPRKMFCESVIVSGKSQPRFRFVGEEKK